MNEKQASKSEGGLSNPKQSRIYERRGYIALPEICEAKAQLRERTYALKEAFGKLISCKPKESPHMQGLHALVAERKHRPECHDSLSSLESFT
jgi:hypothetical protein